MKAKRIKSWDEDYTGYDVNSWFHGTYSYEVKTKEHSLALLGVLLPIAAGILVVFLFGGV